MEYWEMPLEENETTMEMFSLARVLVDKAGSLPCIEHVTWECPRRMYRLCPKDRLSDHSEYAKWKQRPGGEVSLVIDCWRAYAATRHQNTAQPEEGK